MKAMILAAGRGERMRPLTDTCPKPLLKINGLALIEYHISALQNAGISEIVINHAWLGKKIEDYLGDGEKYDVSLSYSPELSALETAGGIIQALPLLIDEAVTKVIDKEKLGKTFIVVNGDIFSDYDFINLMSKAKSMRSNQAHLVMIDNPPHNPTGDFFLDKENLYAQQGKHKMNSKYTFSGIGLYKAEFFSGLGEGKRALGSLLREAMKRGKVTGELYKGQWTDVGTPERLEEINKNLVATN